MSYTKLLPGLSKNREIAAIWLKTDKPLRIPEFVDPDMEVWVSNKEMFYFLLEQYWQEVRKPVAGDTEDLVGRMVLKGFSWASVYTKDGTWTRRKPVGDWMKNSLFGPENPRVRFYRSDRSVWTDSVTFVCDGGKWYLAPGSKRRKGRKRPVNILIWLDRAKKKGEEK